MERVRRVERGEGGEGLEGRRGAGMSPEDVPNRTSVWKRCWYGCSSTPLLYLGRLPRELVVELLLLRAFRRPGPSPPSPRPSRRARVAPPSPSRGPSITPPKARVALAGALDHDRLPPCSAETGDVGDCRLPGGCPSRTHGHPASRTSPTPWRPHPQECRRRCLGLPHHSPCPKQTRSSASDEQTEK